MKRKSIGDRVFESSFWNLAASVIGKIGGLIFTIILARFLVPENYGIYSLVFSIAMIFYTFADLGINQAFVKYLSSALVKEKNKINSYYRYLFRIKLLLTLLASISLFILSYPISHFLFRNDLLFAPLILSSIYIFLLSIEFFYYYTFYIIEKVEYAGLWEIIYQILRIVFSVFVFFTFSAAYHVSGLFLSLILTSLILLFYSYILSRKLAPAIYQHSSEKVDKSRINKFVWYLTLASISSILLSYLDSTMLGFFASPEYVGYYRVALLFILGISGFLSFPIAILLPIFSKIGRASKENIFNKVFYYLSIFILPSSAGILVLGKYFIKTLYGDLYLPASLPLYFLSLAILPIVSIGLFTSLFSSEEKSKVFTKIIFITCLFNIILNFILIILFLKVSPLWATGGVAISTTLSWFIYFLLFIFYLKKEFKFYLSFKPLIKPLIASLVMSLVLYLIMINLSDINPLSGVFLVIGGILIYFISLTILGGLKMNDLKILSRLIRRRGKNGKR